LRITTALNTTLIIFSILFWGPVVGSTEAQNNESLILFSSDIDGNREIYSMLPDGSSMQRLTESPDEDTDPTWSPDHAQIAFVSNRDGNFALYIMGADGSNPRRVTTDTMGSFIGSPAWSPDGRVIAFVSNAERVNQIYTIRPDGSGFRQVTNGDSENIDPAWSPDGDTIAFASNQSGNFEIYTMSADSSNRRQLTSDTSVDSDSPAWSPDGNEIAFAANGSSGELYILESQTNETRLLVSRANAFVSSPTWSPDGREIAYVLLDVGVSRTIQVIDSDGNGLRQITTSDSESNSPAWFTAMAQGDSGAFGVSLDYDMVIQDTITGERGDEWTFNGSTGDFVLIRLNSTDFDSYLELYNPIGQIIASNDDSDGLNSQIGPLQLLDEGIYTIVARDYSRSRSGDYSLELTSPTLASMGNINYDESANETLHSEIGDSWTFAGNANDIVVIRLDSTEFDPLIQLYDNQRRLIQETDNYGSTSIGPVELTTSGEYEIVVRSRNMDRVGRYRIELDLLEIVEPGTLQFGDTVDAQFTNGGGDHWAFEAAAGDVVQIDLSSSQFDPYLELLNANGESIASNDDTNGRNSQIRVTFLESGRYTVITRPYSSGSGIYQLSLALVRHNPIQTLFYGQRVNDDLQSGISDFWVFDGEAGDRITLVMNSTDFDTFLELYNMNNQPIASNDDANGNNSQINFVLPADGSYTVIARGYSGSASGFYNLTLTRIEVSDAAFVLEPNRSVTGSLFSGTNDTWTFEGVAGEYVIITLLSEEFDCYLELRDPSGHNIAADDDSAGNQDSRITITLSATGTYQVIARGYSSDQGGSYTLNLEVIEPVDPSEQTLQLNSTVSSVLHNNRADTWYFEAQRGQNITVELHSEDFDCYLELYDSSGQRIATDDDGAGNLDSRIQISLPSTGQYRIVARSYNSSDGGTYDLVVQGR